MLTVAKVSGAQAAGYADYLQGKTTATERGDYYLKDGERVEAPGRWISGVQALRFDPTGPVSGETLHDLLAVKNPTTGEQLRAAGAGGESVAALDATFSAPKSVSVIWALSDPTTREQIEAAHEQAITRAMQYAVDQVPMVRQRIDADTVRHVLAKDVIATGWRHTTARAVSDRAPDPQLHTHVLLHAAVRSDGRLVAIDSRTWFLHRREIGAAYRTELAHELNRLGFKIERGTGRGGRYFEIDGVPQTVIDRFSSRHQQVQDEIKQRLADTGRQHVTAAEDRLAAISTRSSKLPVTVADLDHSWKADARQQHFTPADALKMRQPVHESLAAASRRDLLLGLTEFDATFTDRDARAVALEKSAGTTINDALNSLRDARRNDGVLDLADGTHTTAWHRANERIAIASFTALANNHLDPINPNHVKTAREAVDERLKQRGGELSREQRTALEIACLERQVVMIEGQAGTGKSTVLQAVALAHQNDGQQIIVTSTAGLAAQRLAGELHEAGVDATALSTVALQHQINTGQLQLDAHRTVIHDEAALASTREQSELFQAVEESGARLIIVGDPSQSLPVGAGGLWHHIEQTARQHDARVELSTNLRAIDPDDRRDQKRFRDGQHREALESFQQRQRLHLHPDQQAAEHAAIEAAHRDRRDGQRSIVIAQTSNEHLDELNAEAQALRLQDGELGEDAIPVPGRPYELHTGDEIQVRHNLNHKDGQIRNGTPARVTDIRDEQLTIELADQTTRELDRQQIEEADLRLAYVQHPFPAQGITTDTTHLIAAEHATREGTYVAITRARNQTHIHAAHNELNPNLEPERDPLDTLAERLGRTEPDVPSIDIPLANESQQHQIENTAERVIEPDDTPGWEI